MGEKWKKIEKKLNDIKEHPERHRHTYDGLTICCFVEGSLVLALVEAHAEHVSLGRNGGVRCDVTSGPCSCGAWH